jgi:DNA-binding FrmR family transcriptional regulator
MSIKRKKAVIALKKARTSIDKILSAMEGDSDGSCFSLMQQNLAVIGLLKSANLLMLEANLDAHIAHMTAGKSQDKEKMQQIRDEVMRIIKTAQNK